MGDPVDRAEAEVKMIHDATLATLKSGIEEMLDGNLAVRNYYWDVIGPTGNRCFIVWEDDIPMSYIDVEAGSD